MESEILFIGGCEDGKRRMVDGMDRVKMPQYNADGTVTAIEYRRERMLCEDVPFAVMVVDGMSMVTAMQNLLEGYKSNAPLHLQGVATAEPCKRESGCSASGGQDNG